MSSTTPSGADRNAHPAGAEATTLRIDRERCIGAGVCVLIAADVFDQDEADGRVIAATTPPAPDRQPAVRAAADLCPAGAIVLLPAQHTAPTTKESSR